MDARTPAMRQLNRPYFSAPSMKARAMPTIAVNGTSEMSSFFEPK